MSWNGKKKTLTPEEEQARALRHRHELHSEIPYIEADPEQGELPLDELDTFIIPARDEKGVSVPVNLHIPPYLERQVEIIVASRRFPYLRVSDFVRHAVTRHCGWLMDIRYSIPRHMASTLATVHDALRDEEFSLQVEQSFIRMDHILAGHINRGDKTEAIKLYVRVRSRIMEAAPCSWKDRYLKEFDSKYSYLLAVERRPELVKDHDHGHHQVA
jgi:Arc/MetJ-type ribon-helix-helix transcriptional regulator